MAPTDSMPVHRETLADAVYEIIRSTIVGHGADPGSRLGIDAFASKLAVSQTPVREALSRLAAEGLATYESLVGYRVAPPLDATEFDRLMEARFVIEPELAALAAQRIDPELAKALPALAAVDDGTSSDDGYEKYRRHIERDSMFHETISRAADNSFLSRALSGLRSHLHIYRLHDPLSGFRETEEEHLAVVSAILSGKSTDAADAMRAHLDASYHRHAAGLRWLE